MSNRITAKDIAEKAGVSRTTVSFVLNNVPGVHISQETRQRVLEAARQMDYHPDATARRLVSGKTRVIGFILRRTPDQVFADRMLPELLGGVSNAAEANNFHVLFKPIHPEDKSEAYARLIRERHVDGLIVAGPRSDDQELLKVYREGAPVVLIGQLPEMPIPFVDEDNIGGAKLATQHLLDLGHRQVALITHAPLTYTTSANRLTGYRQTLEANGIPFDEDLVRYGAFTPESGEQAMRELLQQALRPTAVFAASDVIAAGALRALRLAGLHAPEDMALVGFDDVPLAGFIDPPLTTIETPAAALGWGAAELLVRIITAEEDMHEPNVTLETKLIVRESCGAARRQRRNN